MSASRSLLDAGHVGGIVGRCYATDRVGVGGEGDWGWCRALGRAVTVRPHVDVERVELRNREKGVVVAFRVAWLKTEG